MFRLQLIQMAREPQECRMALVRWGALLMLMGGVNAVLNSVSAVPTAINAIATYTWTITFNSGTQHSPLTLSFPSQVTILSNFTVTVGTPTTNITTTGTSITINSPISSASVSVIIANVRNPPSAISTNSFSYSTANDGTVPLSNVNQVQYDAGTFSSCPWSFSLCTESPSSDLLIPITTANTISAGTNYFLIGFSNSWPNHYSKGLVTGGTITCSYSTNGGANFTGASSCTVNGLTIEFQFIITAPIPGPTAIIVRVGGVNAPPTMQTASSVDYFIYTADVNLTKIDGLTGCAISNVCITNQTSGTFTNTTLNVNANYGNPEIRFPLTPLTITMQKLDTVEVSYSPISSLMSCATLIIYRSGSPLYRLTTPTFGSTSVTFTFPTSAGYNTEYMFPVIAYLQCTSFLLPPSETPVTISFSFKRNSDSYLLLSTPVTASAAAFNSSKGRVSQSTTAMVTSSVLTFNFLTGQPLGSSPAIALAFHIDFVISSPSCTVSVLGLTTTLTGCDFNNATNTVTVGLTASSALPTNSNFTITVSGVRNPATPKSYPFGMSTFFSSSVGSSRVETSSSAFSTTITQIANYPVSLSPVGLTVYSPANIVLSFVPNITLPIFSAFSVQFPPNVSFISPNTNILTVGVAPQPLSGSVTTVSTTVTFVSGAEIASGSSVSITVPLTTPNNIGTYSYVKLVVSNNSTSYLSSRSSLFLNVDAVNSMSVSIMPSLAVTGQTTSYSFLLTLSIPHSTTFIVQIDVPSDSKFFSSGATCTNCLNSALSAVNESSFSFTANNPNGTTTQTISFSISSFMNRRSVGPSVGWGIATKTVSPTNLISYTFANASITRPNSLTAALSKSDSYYRSNSSPVKMTITFFNQLVSGDYILFSFTSSSYTASSVTCSSIYGACSIEGTPTNVTVVKLIPNTTSIINGTLFAILEGLTSAAATDYSYSTTITVTTLTSSGALIDSGPMTYNISCGAVPNNFCKQCYFNNSCINCYSGYYLQGAVCVSSCGTASSFMSYSNSTTGTCVPCINNCLNCSSDIVCLSCLPNYFFYTSDSSCRLTCPTTAGYFTANGRCEACVADCLECANSSNSCTRCSQSTFLIAGLCQSGCGSTNYYQLNGQCLPCDRSCYNCSGAGASNCFMCSSTYHRYLTLCVEICPTGTAINPSTGDCGCDAACLTCSTYASCTACLNSSLWALNGGCVSSCPMSTYANAGQCIACSSGCLNCTINTCTACVDSSYLFNNSCYSDCNLISQQYDVVGSSCVLCPTGCDHCAGTNCTSCLDAYTLTAAQCIKTCLLSDSCDLTAQVLPLPGLLSLALWGGIAVVMNLLYHKNYLPYSIILFSGVIQFVLQLALLSSVDSPAARLLAADSAYRSQMKGLLGGAIAANYLENLCYLAVFIFYIKPLIANPRQIDVISNVVVLVIATATNFRFGLVAFARMFPKPNIFVRDGSKLTPVHYLCLASLCLDLLSVVACGLGLINSQKLSNTFMLSLDLIIVVAVNMAITVWFVAAKKPAEYFEDSVKKYHIEDNAHARTDETLPNEKNVSKANMVGNESFNFDDFDRTENDDSYNKFAQNKSGIHNGQAFMEDTIKENPLPVTVLARSKRGDPDPFVDPNFEDNIKSKRSTLKESSMVISKAEFGKAIDKEGKSVEENLSARKNHVVTSNFSKDPAKSERKRLQPPKNIVEVEESDYPDLEERSEKGAANVFNSKQRLPKPKKVKEARARGVEEPLKVMKKGGEKKIGYFESDAYESNADGEDLQEIIKQKIWQSTIKLEKPSLSSGLDSETAHEEISPSWFNIQNQRLDVTDLEAADPE